MNSLLSYHFVCMEDSWAGWQSHQTIKIEERQWYSKSFVSTNDFHVKLIFCVAEQVTFKIFWNCRFDVINSYLLLSFINYVLTILYPRIWLSLSLILLCKGILIHLKSHRLIPWSYPPGPLTSSFCLSIESVQSFPRTTGIPGHKKNCHTFFAKTRNQYWTKRSVSEIWHWRSPGLL